jgi:hypothetical protein
MGKSEQPLSEQEVRFRYIDRCCYTCRYFRLLRCAEADFTTLSYYSRFCVLTGAEHSQESALDRAILAARDFICDRWSQRPSSHQLHMKLLPGQNPLDHDNHFTRDGLKRLWYRTRLDMRHLRGE